MEAVTVPTRLGRKTVTADNIADGVVPSTDPKDSGATGSTSSTTAPTEFAAITTATYSAKNITGSSDWVEVTTASDHGYSKGDKVTIYGLNNNLVNADGTFLVTESVSNTVFRYSPSLNGFYSSVVNLTTSFTVTQRSRTTAIATLKLSTTSHGLIAGSVITVTDVPDQTDYNGTFFINSVSGDTITYKFESELATSEATTSSTGTVHAVTHKYAIVGDTWIDTSVTPSTYKVWNGLKWTDSSNIPDGVIVDDHMAPAAPTELSATQNGYYDSSSGSPKIAIDLKWSAPTTNADGSTLRDLAGYKVYYKYTKGVDSTGNAGSGAVDTTTTNTDGTLTGTFSYHPNIAQSAATVTFSTSAGTIQPTSITVDGKTSGKVAWTISGLSDSQEVTMTWSTPSNGYGDITGTTGSTDVVSQHNNAAPSFSYDIFGNTALTESTQPTAVDPETGGASTAITSWQDGPDVPSTSSPSVVIKDFNTSSEIQFAVKAYDSSKKNYSVMSDALTVSTGVPAIVVNAPSKPSVEVRLGTATITWDGNDNAGNVPPPSLNYLEVHIGSTSGFTPSDSTYKGSISFAGSAGNFIVVDGLTYNSSWYAKFVAVSTTGTKTNPSAASDQFTIVPLVDTDLIANTLTNWPFVGGVVSATALANGAVSARTLAQNAINSSNIANVITPGAISTGLIAANAIGAEQIAAGSIVAGKIGAGAITANEIAANTISAGMIKANAIEADKIAVGAVDATKITATAIDGKTITGATIRTGASGARIQMDSSGFYAYNSSGSLTFSISASTGAVTAVSYATSSDLSSGLSNKVSVGGAATDINNYNVQISGTKIIAGSIDVGKLTAGELVGFTIKTASSGDRIQMTTSTMTFYGSSGTVNATIQAGVYGYLMTTGTFTMYAGNSVFYVEVSPNNNIHYSTTSGFEFYTTGTYGVSIQNGKGLYSAGPNWFDGSIKYVGRPGSSTAGSPIHVRTTGSGADLLFEYVSSREYKSDIKDIDLDTFDYEKFMSIPIKSFAYNEDYELHGDNAMRIYGYIAEDLDDAGFHDLVVYKDLPDGTRKVHSLAFHSINAITQAIVNSQAEKIKSLEARLSMLESN